MRSSFEKILRSEGIRSEAVIQAMLRVPRDQFVSSKLLDQAWENHPLSIGYEQTISQPYIVALMTEMLDVKQGDKILEVGTGCGYQTAILCELGAEVYSIEIIPPLAKQARKRLKRMHYDSAHLRTGDACDGWHEQAPFDSIIITAAPPQLPRELIRQVRPGGRIVVPEGIYEQHLHLYEVSENQQLRIHSSVPVRFVPMTGKVQP